MESDNSTNNVERSNPPSPDENPATYLLYQEHARRRKEASDRINRLLVDHPEYYYRQGDTDGTQG